MRSCCRGGELAINGETMHRNGVSGDLVLE